MLGDAARAIGNITNFSFAQIMLIQFIKESVIRIRCVVLVFRINGHQVVETTGIKHFNNRKANKTTVTQVKSAPKLILFLFPTVQKLLKAFFIHLPILHHIVFVNALNYLKTAINNQLFFYSSVFKTL